MSLHLWARFVSIRPADSLHNSEGGHHQNLQKSGSVSQLDKGWRGCCTEASYPSKDVSVQILFGNPWLLSESWNREVGLKDDVEEFSVCYKSVGKLSDRIFNLTGFSIWQDFLSQWRLPTTLPWWLLSSWEFYLVFGISKRTSKMLCKKSLHIFGEILHWECVQLYTSQSCNHWVNKQNMAAT